MGSPYILLKGDFLSRDVLKKRIIVCVAPLLVLLVLFVAACFALNYIKMPACVLNYFTGLYCPACGNTRAVIALMHGDILLSIRENPVIIIGLIYLILLYTEVVARAFGKISYRSPVRHFTVMYIVLGLLAIFWIVRNFIPELAPIAVY